MSASVYPAVATPTTNLPAGATSLITRVQANRGSYEYTPGTPLAAGKYMVNCNYNGRGNLTVQASSGVAITTRNDNQVVIDVPSTTATLQAYVESFDAEPTIQNRGLFQPYPSGINSTAATVTAYGSGRFIAQNTDGTIQISVGGYNSSVWRSVDSGNSWVNIGRIDTLINSANAGLVNTNYETYSVEYSNGRFIIASGPSSTTSYAISSPDGYTWTAIAQLSGIAPLVRTSAATSNIWVGGSHRTSNNIMYTLDGVNLGFVSPTGFTGNTTFVMHDGTKFVAFDDASHVTTSTNGYTWTTAVTIPFVGRGMVFTGGTYYAVSTSGVFYSSTNLTAWTLTSTQSTNGQGNHEVQLVGSTLVYKDPVNLRISTSTDGVNWVIRRTSLSQYSTLTKVGNTLWYQDNSNTALRSTDGVNWTWKDLSVMGAANPNGIAFGAGVWVAVANTSGSNTIISSTDTATWVGRTNPTGQNLQAITYANGIFVSVGGGGAIVTSTDGVTWTSRTSNTANQLNAVAYSSSLNLWVAVGVAGTIVTATDPTSPWVVRTSATGSTQQAVTFANGFFVSVGQSGTIQYSANGTTGWTLVGIIGYNNPLGAVYSTITNSLTGVAYSATAGRWIAVSSSGTFFTSTVPAGTYNVLGTTYWTAFGPNLKDGNSNFISSQTLYGLLTVNNVFYAFGVGGAMYASTDGINWQSRSVTSGSINALAYSGSTFMALVNGSGGITAVPSTDGLNWVQDVRLLTTSTAYTASYGNGRYVISNSGNIMTTTDWKSFTFAFNLATGGGYTLANIVYGNGVFVAAANTSSFTYWSTDGLNWTACVGNGSTQTYANNNIIFEDGRFWKIYGQRLAYSIDGKTWFDYYTFDTVNYPTPPTTIKKVDGYYVAIGGSRYYWTNPQLLTNREYWTIGDLGTAVALNDVDGIDGMYVFATAGSSYVSPTLVGAASYLLPIGTGVGGGAAQRVWVSGNRIYMLQTNTVFQVLKGIDTETSAGAAFMARAYATSMTMLAGYWTSKVNNRVLFANNGVGIIEQSSAVPTTISIYSSTMTTVN